MNKIILEFDYNFWPDDAKSIYIFSEEKGHFPIFVNKTNTMKK